MHILVAGCGDVGSRLGRIMSALGHQDFGLRRSAGKLPGGIVAISADLTRPATLLSLPDRIDRIRIDRIVFLPTPNARDEAAYNAIFRKGLANLLAALTDFDGRLVVVSSTAVHGQDDGSLVNEHSTARPARFNGRVLLEMERDAARSVDHCVVVRFSGIYGPGRNWLIRSVLDGTADGIQKTPPLWTNRIHADDAAAVLAHLLLIDEPQELYLASDDCPAPKYEVMSWLAERLDVASPEPQTREGGSGGKRIDAGRLRRSGYRMRYPDYRAGYAGLLEGTTET